MLEVNYKKGGLRVKEIWFARRPYLIKGANKTVFMECYEKIDLEGFRQDGFDTSIIDLSKDLDSIWKNMKEKSCRYAIKRAQRDGIEIEINKNYREFFKIVNKFLKAMGLEGLSRNRFEQIKDKGVLFTARQRGEFICGNFYLNDDRNIRLLFSASRRYSTTDKTKITLIGNANKLIHWEAVKYAKEKGLVEYDLGGVFLDKQNPAYSNTEFKLSFGGELVKRYNYKSYSSGLSYLWEGAIIISNKIFR